MADIIAIAALEVDGLLGIICNFIFRIQNNNSKKSQLNGRAGSYMSILIEVLRNARLYIEERITRYYLSASRR